jgi:hypothetical protein
LLAGGHRVRPALAQQTPTPAPTPNYSKVDDITGGRRQLLRTDDLVFSGSFTIDENTTAYAGAILDTENSEVKSVETIEVLDDLVVEARSNPSLVRARMFNLDHDVVISAYHANSGGGVLKYVVNPGRITSGEVAYNTPVRHILGIP